MKKLMLLAVLLAGMVLVQGCSAGSGISLAALVAGKLSNEGEQQLIEKVKSEFVVWHEEQHISE